MNLQININVCRVCMKSETVTSMLGDESLQSKFEFVTHLRVKTDDNLPAMICEKCILLLNLAHKFIQSAQETEENLKTFLAKINNDFKLVTKTSPIKTGIIDDVDGMLELLGDADTHLQLENISTIFKETLPKEKSDVGVDSKDNSKPSEIYDSDIEELSSLEEIYSPKYLTTYKNEDDGGSRSKKQVTHYSDVLTGESSEIIEYKQLGDMLVTEEENSQMDTENKEQPINKHRYLEDYEAMHEDEFSTMDILYEDNDNVLQGDVGADMNVDSLQEINDSALLVEAKVVNMASPNEISKQEENVISPVNEVDVESAQIASQEEETQNWSSSVVAVRKLNASVAQSTRFYCSKCNRDFSTKTNLTRHLQLHDGKRPYQCTICQKGFSQNGTLKQHMYTHTGEKPHVCHVCNRGFTQSKSLVFHLRRHTGDKPYQCDYCNMLFRQKDALKVHILKHHTDVGDRAFSCKICNKEMNAHELQRHMKKHLNNHKTVKTHSNEIIPGTNENELMDEPIFIADEVSFDVHGSTHVVDIMATSTIEPRRAKKYQCRTCFKCFAIEKNLIRHLSFHYAQTSGFEQCSTCDLVFDTNHALKVHRVCEHKETNINLNECEECQMKFRNAAELSNHMRQIHTFKCSQCPNLSFSTEKLFNDHLLEHNIDEIEEFD